MRYVVAKKRQLDKDTAYRIYITDSIYYQSQNKALSVRYADLISDDTDHAVDDRTPDEIISDIRAKLSRSDSK